MSSYTFNPPEEELINYYLNNKITEMDDLVGREINEVIICHHEPSDLPLLAKIESSHTWYFTSKVEKFGRLNRTKRSSKTGHWKITGNSCTVKDFNGNPIGLKKFLVFQENKNKKSSTTSPSIITTQQHKFTWIIHEYHSFLDHPNKDVFVLCKLMKKTRTRQTGTDVFPAETEVSPTLVTDPSFNHSQMSMRNQSTVEDYGGNYCNDLEELVPEIYSASWLDHSYDQFDNFHWESAADLTHAWEQGESSGLPLGKSGHVYGQTPLSIQTVWNSEALVRPPLHVPYANNDKI